jgi:hypothetical protein
MIKNNTYYSLLFLITIVCTIVYIFFTSGYVEEVLSDAQNREIETPQKLWVNGYLGLFFAFKNNGNIIWLLPIIFAFAYNKIKSNKSVNYFLALFIMLFTLIALKGYINGRYQFTLVPACIIALTVLIPLIEENKKAEKRIFYFLFFMTLFNTAYFIAIDYWPRYKERFIALIGKNEHSEIVNKNTHEAISYIEYIEKHIKPNEKVLVNNLPEYFYFTDRKGVYCWTESDDYYSKNGILELRGNKSDEAFKNFILNDLQCKYILTTQQFNTYNASFELFLTENCQLIFSDNKKYLIYKL